MIILDARRIKAYEFLEQLVSYCGRDEDYGEELWTALLQDDELMGAFMYYLDHHSLYDGLSSEGYGLTDLYFYNLRRSEMQQDLGKSSPESNKEALVLDTFLLMAGLRREPEKYLRRLQGGLGMDAC